MNNEVVMVDVSEASASFGSKKSYVAPTGPQNLSLRGTKGGTQSLVDGGFNSSSSSS